MLDYWPFKSRRWSQARIDALVGTFVRSHFRSAWYGVILEATERGDYCPLIDCLIVKSRRGVFLRTRTTFRLSLWWCEPIAPFDLSPMNPRWLRHKRTTIIPESVKAS